MTRRRPWAVWTLALLFVLLGIGPASAADGLIEHVEVRDGEVTVSLAEFELPLEARPEDSVVLTIDGVAVDARVDAVSDEATSGVEQRTVVVVLDTSGSMHGAGLANARQAAEGLLAELPADVRVGLVTFSSEVRLHVTPTLDRAAVSAALRGLAAGGRTRLYDAVPVALTAAGATGERRLMILSDGKNDDVSSITVAAAAAAIASSGVTVDVLDASSDASGAGLGPLAEAGKGRAVSASGADAIEVFTQLAQSYATQVTVSAALPPEHPGGAATVRVEVHAVGGMSSEERAVRLPVPDYSTPPGQVATADTGARPTAFWVMLAAVGLGVFLILAVAVVVGDSRAHDSRRTKEVLSAYGRQPHVATAATAGSFGGDSQLTQSALNLAERALERRGSAEKLALALDRAGLTWRPHEWLLLWTVSTVIGAALSSLLLGGGVLALLLGASVGWLGPRMWLRRTARRRQKAFLMALPDSLQLLASSLSSGYSLAQALDALVQEGSQPMAGEMGRALAEARIGRSLEDALDAVAERMECEDFRWVVMAVRVQRQVGGNLAEVLARVCATMRDRASLRRQVQALSAEGRMSAYLLIALPIALGAFMFFFRRDYFRPMYTETIGIVALGVTAVMMVVGTVWMNKLIKVDL